MREKDFCSRTSGNPTVRERQREKTRKMPSEKRFEEDKGAAWNNWRKVPQIFCSEVAGDLRDNFKPGRGADNTGQGRFPFYSCSAPYMSLLGQARALSLLGWKVHQKLHLHQPVYQNGLMFVSGAHRRSKQCLPHPQNMLSDKLGTPLMPEDTFLHHPNKRGTGTHPTMSCSLSWS